MCMYSIARTNLLLYFLMCLVVRSMTMATGKNKHETEKVKKIKNYIYIYNTVSVLLVMRYFNHSQGTK